MSGRLTGRKALVTGGARGIGAAVARRLAADGADVAINYRSSGDAAEALAAEITADGSRAVAIKADVSDPDQIRRLADEADEALGGLDILVSNAGIEYFGKLDDVTPADFDRVFAINTRAQFFAVQNAARHMGEGGRIVLTSSQSAHKAVFYHALYASSKAAVECIALNLSPELGFYAVSPSTPSRPGEPSPTCPLKRLRTTSIPTSTLNSTPLSAPPVRSVGWPSPPKSPQSSRSWCRTMPRSSPAGPSRPTVAGSDPRRATAGSVRAVWASTPPPGCWTRTLASARS